MLFLFLFLKEKLLVARIGVGFGNQIRPVEMDGIDIVLDDGARVTVFDALHEDVGIQFVGKIAHLDAEIGFGENDIDFDIGIGLLKAALQVEGVVAGIGAREGGDLDTVARNGLNPLIEFDMFLDQVAHLHIARNLHLSLLTLSLKRTYQK